MSIPSVPIPVTHPNDLGLDPGEQTDLYYYDGSPMGSSTGEWRKAGTGTVSTDGGEKMPISRRQWPVLKGLAK